MAKPKSWLKLFSQRFGDKFLNSSAFALLARAVFPDGACGFHRGRFKTEH